MSIMCLYTCIKYNCTKPYFYVSNRGSLIVTPCKTRKDILLLLKRTSIENYIKKRRDEQFLYRITKAYRYAIYENVNFKEKVIRFYQWYRLQMPIGRYPRYFILNIQARYIIASIDRYFGSEYMHNWSKRMKKHTITK